MSGAEISSDAECILASITPWRALKLPPLKFLSQDSCHIARFWKGKSLTNIFYFILFTSFSRSPDGQNLFGIELDILRTWWRWGQDVRFPEMVSYQHNTSPPRPCSTSLSAQDATGFWRTRIFSIANHHFYKAHIFHSLKVYLNDWSTSGGQHGYSSTGIDICSKVWCLQISQWLCESNKFMTRLWSTDVRLHRI